MNNKTRMNELKNVTIGFLCLMMAMPVGAKIWTIGDSTMSNYKAGSERMGWGQAFGKYIRNNEVHNRAHSGYSSKMYYTDPTEWNAVKDSLSKGDFLIISFGHNDEKARGLDLDSVQQYGFTNEQIDNRGTSPNGSFRTYLTKFVEEARLRGATPILVSPICRRTFDDQGKVSRNGNHDLGGKYRAISPDDHKLIWGTQYAYEDSTMSYTYNMKELAKELKVPYFDLTRATRMKWEEIYAAGGMDSLKQYFRHIKTDDNTHLNAAGADIVAKMVAKMAWMQKSPLKQYIIPASIGYKEEPKKVIRRVAAKPAAKSRRR